MRKLYEIAREIRHDWKKPYFGAVPYIAAMESIGDVSERYIAEDGYNVVAYFLANAGTWRGDVARRVKTELKNMLDGRRS